MSRNVLTNTAIATEENNNQSKINLSEKQKSEFVKAVKIGYYKDFCKQGLITEEELKLLIELLDKKSKESAA